MNANLLLENIFAFIKLTFRYVDKVGLDRLFKNNGYLRVPQTIEQIYSIFITDNEFARGYMELVKEAKEHNREFQADLESGLFDALDFGKVNFAVSQETQTGIMGIVGNLIGSAVSITDMIKGNSASIAASNAQAEAAKAAAKAANTKMIIGGVIGAIVIIVVLYFVFKK